MEPSRIAVPSSSHLIEPEEDKAYEGLGITTVKLLHTRELCGNVTTSARGKCNFRDEYTNILASKPVIWKYSVRENISRALEQVEVIAHMPNGEFRTDLLISGDINGTLRYHVIDKDTTQIFPSGVRSTPEYAWPLDIENKDEVAKSPGHLWTLGCSNSFGRGNPIGCLKKMGKPGQQKILYPLYTLTPGNRITAVGSVYVLRLNDPLMLDGRFSNTSPNLLRIADINFRILDADCNSDGSRALFGTNKGVTIMDLETGVASREKIALCGLENGAIVSVDTRQPHKHAWFTPTLNLQSLIMHSKRGRFELHGNIYESRTLSLSPPRFTSSISCLTSLKLYKQYFLASSEDGTEVENVKLKVLVRFSPSSG
ncbi:uncharacterized protein LOC108224549 [Daucus carota subsp. sativus]|uniref:uncharacterized protein LOC108224549 n=1 Tax=Daucus carota subsp. sativus TaxID=79200 RepID=UPI00308276F3